MKDELRKMKMKETGSNEGKQKEPQQDNLWLNIGKILFLIAALVAAWFALDWLIRGKSIASL